MKTYTADELKVIIANHYKWLMDEDGGMRADLRNSDLRNSDLRNSDLSGSDLRNSDLSGSDLSGSNLSGSDLRNSNLSGSDLSGSNLSGSNLRNSDLSGSNLSGSDLRNSDLRNSDLSGSNLRNSDLSGSDLSGELYELARIGSSYRKTIWDATNDIVWCGCFKGTIAEFEDKVESTHAKNPLFLGQYRLAIKYLRDLKSLKESLK